MAVRFPELGFYTLPGRVADPRPMLQEVRDAEAAGLGSVWISERQDVKEAAALSGAAGALTQRARGRGRRDQSEHAPHHVTAAIGSTMSALTGGRFALGLGRGFDMRSDMWGVPRVTGKMLEDTARPAASPVGRREDLRPRWSGREVRLPEPRLPWSSSRRR